MRGGGFRGTRFRGLHPRDSAPLNDQALRKLGMRCSYKAWRAVRAMQKEQIRRLLAGAEPMTVEEMAIELDKSLKEAE